MDKFFGCLKYASELRTKIIRETGLPISFGLSQNKTVSKIATGEAKPNNQIRIDLGTEKEFLSPLSVRKIPMVGLKTFQTLCEMGIRRINTVQNMPIQMMEGALGQNGVAIWKKANGIDMSPVVQYNKQKSISSERTFDKDTIDVTRLKSILVAMVESLILQLRRENKVCACITVKIRYSDFDTKTLQKKVPYTAADHEILPIVAGLFDKLYNRRVLVRLIGLRFSELVQGSHQFSLFEDSPKLTSLYQSMDHIRDRFGDRAVMRASGMEIKSMSRMNPFNGKNQQTDGTF